MSIEFAGYSPLPNGFWIKDDGTGPYVRTAVGAFALAGTGSGGAGGGGGGDASAANQASQIALETTTDAHASRLTSTAGRKTAGSALATTAWQVGGTYNSTPPTLTNGQEASIQFDASGNLKVALTGSGDASAANQTTQITATGSLTETAPATDTASSGLNGRLQRIAQRLTSLIGLLPTALGATTASASLPVVLSSDGPFATQTGSITETAPASDTASSGLNGRLQRIAQRITSMIALLPTALGAGGGLKIDGSGTAVPVSLASVPSHAVTNAGTFAVQSATTLAAETTKVIGTVNLAAAQTLATVTTVAAVTAITNALPAGTNGIGKVSGFTIDQAASATIARPADTTAYASGDLIANSVTAGSVNALQFTTAARVSGGSGVVLGAKIQKSTNVVASVAMRLHLFTVTPTFTSAGDNSAMTTVVVASAKGYLGYIDIPAFVGFSDVAWGTGAPDNSRGSLPFVAAAQILYGIVEARGAFTPGNAEVYTVSIFVLQD